MVRGYRVTTTWLSVSPEEVAWRKAALLRLIASSLYRRSKAAEAAPISGQASECDLPSV